jgi:Protein of unknown function (DUF3501)
MDYRMPRESHDITTADILPLPIWGEQRKAQRTAISELKRNRRVSVGPHATLYFENWDTMWYQVQEMLWIEKGGDAQLPDELAAYNPMIPQGDELSATLMFEIPDETKRRRILAELGGIEENVSISIAGMLGSERVAGIAEVDLDRTTADGKTSAVHFVHFAFTAAQIAAFRDPENEVMIRIDHANYAHAGIVGSAVRAALAEDFG